MRLTKEKSFVVLSQGMTPRDLALALAPTYSLPLLMDMLGIITLEEHPRSAP